MRRVVITGLGIVSCLGNSQEEVHQSLFNSKSGISYSEEYKEHNPEDKHDPTSLELYCDANPDAEECRVYDD